MEQKKTGGQKGFAMTNIIMGAILTISSGIMFAEANAIGGLITVAVGLTLLIAGSYALKFFKQHAAGGSASADGAVDARRKKVGLMNKICFIVSCLLLAMVLILPIIGPML